MRPFCLLLPAQTLGQDVVRRGRRSLPFCLFPLRMCQVLSVRGDQLLALSSLSFWSGRGGVSACKSGYGLNGQGTKTRRMRGR